MEKTPVIIWFRKDLRIGDNPALNAASQQGHPVIPLYIWDEKAPHALGGAQKWWLHHTLSKLAHSLKKNYGLTLILRRGDESATISNIIKETGACDIFWNRRYSPSERATDSKLKEELSAHSFNGNLLFEPWEVKPKSGGDFCKVFTPFWKQCLTKNFTPPLPAPEKIIASTFTKSDNLDDWQLCPTTPNWAIDFDTNAIGEDAAQETLENFLQHGINGYKELRNRPDLPHTSTLSPNLSFGEITPRQIAAMTEQMRGIVPEQDIDCFLSEIGWREFSYHLLYHLDNLPTKPLREQFNNFPWADTTHLSAWQKGQTGYPIVDAAMRQLWHTGWMHNRCRMIVASFLVKHLRIHWHDGAAWFWDTLLDADLASNSASWQWVTGCGADAAPYFRIFNPITQGEKFDPEGIYIKKWVPELRNVPLKKLFAPWEMSEAEQKKASTKIGEDYPPPIVNHKNARETALAAFKSIST